MTVSRVQDNHRKSQRMRVERESVFDKHCYCNKQEFRFHTQLLFCEDAPAGCLTSAFGKGWAKSDRRAFA